MLKTTLLLLLACTPALAEDVKKPRKYIKDMAETDFSRRDLNGRDYAQYNLENCVFNLCIMKGMKLAGACLAGSDFASATLDKADCSNADLRNVKGDYASAQGTNFENADLRGAMLTKWSVQKANLRGADLRNVKGMGDITGADFTGADLRGAVLQDAKDYSNSAIFKDAKYDKLTRWPRGFDLESSGAKFVKAEEPKKEP